VCTVLQFRLIDPLIDEDEILSAARKFGFRVEGSRVWRAGSGEAVFRVDGYAAGGKASCCCPLADDPEGLARLRGLLEFLLPRCSELYYAADEICLEEEPAEEIEPAAVQGAWRPGTVAPWGRVRMPERFARGLSRLARLMRRAGIEADAGRSADGGFGLFCGGEGTTFWPSASCCAEAAACPCIVVNCCRKLSIVPLNGVELEPIPVCGDT